MTLLALVLARAGGRARALLVAGSTAVVTALLLVAVAVLRLPGRPHEALFGVVADPGTRPGMVLAVLLLTVPCTLLLHQALRLGTSARERRLAGLRLAGATPADVRRISAVEVGLPALAGSLAGILLFLALRVLLGGRATPRPGNEAGVGSGWRLVPVTAGPTWWQVLGVVGAVTLLGVLVGWWATSGLVVSPLGVSRRQPSRPPRPWGALLLVLAVVLAGNPRVVTEVVDPTATGYAVAIVALAVLGITGLASWTAYCTARGAQRLVRSAPALLAVRRLVMEPRPAGRAAAAVGGISLVSGGTAVVLASFTSDGVDGFYLVSLALIAAALLVALVVVVGSLAVHSTETLLDQKRSMAALVAQGASVDDLARSQRWEMLLAALPVAVLGVLLGTMALGGPFFWGASRRGVVIPLNLLLTPVAVVLATVLATALTRPLVRWAASPEHLRTE